MNSESEPDLEAPGGELEDPELEPPPPTLQTPASRKAAKRLRQRMNQKANVQKHKEPTPGKEDLRATLRSTIQMKSEKRHVQGSSAQPDFAQALNIISKNPRILSKLSQEQIRNGMALAQSMNLHEKLSDARTQQSCFNIAAANPELLRAFFAQNPNFYK